MSQNYITIKNSKNISITISELKRSSSEESISSTSTFSDSSIKRRKKINYLQGQGVVKWTPKTRLLLGDVDITSLLNKYRRKNFKTAEKSNDLSDMKLLSLSHIFPINRADEAKCITKHFKEADAKTSMHHLMYREVVFKRASTEAVMFCKNISDYTECDFEPSDELGLKIKACCLLLKTTAKYHIQDNSETSFIQKYVLPYLNEVFMVNPNKYSICAMVDGVEESGSIPDWKLGYLKHRNKPLFTFFVEVKRLGSTSKYQAESDYVKLMKEMKDSLDKQINLGLTSPFSFGLLVKGIRCELYMMRIKEEGLYMPMMIKRFSLMERVEDAVNIPALVESLMLVKETMASIDDMFRKRSKNSPLKEFTKPSFRTGFE